MDIPVNAKVQCNDGPGGRSTYVVIDPKAEQVTHLVVRYKKDPHTEFLVEIDQVESTSPTSILLHCSTYEMEKMDHFIDHEYIPVTEPATNYSSGDYTMLHHSVPAVKRTVTIDHENVPEGELAVSGGAHVEATDGHVGRVDEFLVEPENGHITHLVMREGHLWGQKEVAIPVSEIERMREETVYLKLDKDRVHDLPAVPVRRWVHESSHNVG